MRLEEQVSNNLQALWSYFMYFENIFSYNSILIVPSLPPISLRSSLRIQLYVPFLKKERRKNNNNKKIRKHNTVQYYTIIIQYKYIQYYTSIIQYYTIGFLSIKSLMEVPGQPSKRLISKEWIPSTQVFCFLFILMHTCPLFSQLLSSLLYSSF